MTIAIGADHAGFDLKESLKVDLVRQGCELQDVGAHVYDATDDYPDFAEKVAILVSTGKVERGVLICGSGVGATIAANKIPNVRACVCTETYSGHQGVEHDSMNVLVLASRVSGIEVAKECLMSFIGARFSGEERHARRLAKVNAIEMRYRGKK